MSATMETDRALILARLDELGRLLAARDPAIVEVLTEAVDFALFGSEAGEEAHGREGVAALFGGLFAKPYRLVFAWEKPAVTVAGSIAWVTAEGVLHLEQEGGALRLPYRMVGIFERRGEAWVWRLFSGSEPAPPPDLSGLGHGKGTGTAE